MIRLRSLLCLGLEYSIEIIRGEGGGDLVGALGGRGSTGVDFEEMEGLEERLEPWVGFLGRTGVDSGEYLGVEILGEFLEGTEDWV